MHCQFLAFAKMSVCPPLVLSKNLTKTCRSILCAVPKKQSCKKFWSRVGASKNKAKAKLATIFKMVAYLFWCLLFFTLVFNHHPFCIICNICIAVLVVSNLVDIFYHPEQTTEYGYVVDVASKSAEAAAPAK